MNSLAYTSYANMDLDEVDLADMTCLVPCFEPWDALVRSIACHGLINLPVVRPLENGRYVPVLGRRRLAAAAGLAWTRVPVRRVSPDLSEADCFALAFWDNVSHRRLDTALTAYLTARLLDLISRERVVAEFLPALGISVTGPRLDRLRAVGKLDLGILEAMSHGRILDKTAYLLAGLDNADRALVIDLAAKLGLNANKTAELTENLVDLSIFHDRPLAELVADPDGGRILHDPDLASPERASRFRELIRSWKFPELAAKEKEFRAWVKTLPLSGKVSVRPTQAFEDQRCTVEIRADSWQEAEQIVKAIVRAAN
ncbi:MAG: ParB/Srx family N-terminal domain-containing protein [Thermodesulfobacteriota bacterium]